MKSYSKTSDIKVGVVGYGGAFNMGKKHLNELKAQGMVPVAVAEMDPTRLEAATTDFPGIAKFASIDEMLAGSDVDLIVLITPHNTHAELALKALKAGRHVVCEKPLAITTAECDAMIAAADASGVMLSTYHNRHWDGIPLTAIKLLSEDKLGEIYKIHCRMGTRVKPGDWWRTSRTISGGQLYDWGVHLLEYSLQLIKSEIVEVSGFAFDGFWADQTRWGDDANEDEATAIVRFASGARVELTITNLDSDPAAGMMRVVGTKGSVTFLDPHESYRLVQKDGPSKTTIEGKQEETQQELYYQNVAEYLTGKADLIITPEWSRRPIHILDLAGQSAKAGKALPAVYQ
ncbi:Gfo/Idh/MocA family protein [Cerasicoccus arenae]|uniref:Oxidoreductase n=1 Tax=Cerasicoccus arenae TaxID=424488 RepID=A0A8J3DB10_9BACT|nr:Gfo/Idh/MocA family oxidoreductase [Cerasicoccus arenae]MBK1858829.1 Gfo/Idh/MocA family oxidoreductase [Cerasicoccus arenae]GHC04355.1 oxidoreductase [Cerasicoccus arenae]